LFSGIALLVQGGWLSGNLQWLVAKIIALSGYIAFSLVVMRNRGRVRWLAFAASLTCFAYIVGVAISKNPWFFIFLKCNFTGVV